MHKSAEKYNKTQLFIAVDPKSYLVAYNSNNEHLLLENLEIEGVYEDPEEAFALSCEDTSADCDFYDTEYPIESALVDPLKMQIVQELLLKYQIPLDNKNNAENDPQFTDVRFRKK